MTTSIKYLNAFISLLLPLFCLTSCVKDQLPYGPVLIEQAIVEHVQTDKSRYLPGEVVRISAVLERTDFDHILLRCKHLNNTIHQEQLMPEHLISLEWTPPKVDFRGYSIELECIKDAASIAYASTAVDVSSDWSKFPRYGFLSHFPEMDDERIRENLERLNIYHINSIQFYDWHHKHHAPLPMNEGVPAAEWPDIARRNTSFDTVEKYIQSAKSFNMASMAYNLIYGAWDDFANDGVSPEWMIYNDASHRELNKHDLDENWALSDIYLANPANVEWQEHIFAETEKVYSYLGFDGWHLDQLGHRGKVYDYHGKSLELWQTFIPFLNRLKQRFPDKKMVLNAVNQYGQREILATETDFAYSEVWQPNGTYADLAAILWENRSFNPEVNSVLAAYINYEAANQPGMFNDAAVLMADAVIMAFGGAHIELGEHMLAKEYFPNDNLRMSGELSRRLVEYYDFMVAHQNLLRDGGSYNLNPDIQSEVVPIKSWPPALGNIAAIAKQVDKHRVLHLINFDGLSSLKWKDEWGRQAAPNIHRAFTIEFPASGLSKVTYTSPDWHDGVQAELDFEVSNGYCEVEIPFLEYWGMLIIE